MDPDRKTSFERKPSDIDHKEIPNTGTPSSDSSDEVFETPSASMNQQTESKSSASADAPQAKELSPDRLPLGQAVKRFPKLVGWCMALTLAIIGWGYDLVIVSSITAVDSFREDFGDRHGGKTIIPARWLSTWLGLPLAGNALGCLFGGWLGDRIGRRFTLMTGSLISGAAISIIFCSHLPEHQEARRGMFSAGLMIQGFSIGIIKTACLTYVSENAPTAIRASAMALFPTCQLAGQLLGAIVVFIINDVEGNKGYRGAFGSQWILTVAPFTISLFMPESPAQLIRVGKRDQALHAATRLFAPKVDPHVVLARVEATIEEERAISEGITYYHVFRGVDLRRTLIVVLANIFPALFGTDLLASVSYFLGTIGVESSTALLFQIAGIVCGMLGNAVGLWVMTRVGRRNAVIVTLFMDGVWWGAVGISGIWRGATVGYVAAAFMILVVITSGLGAWPAGYAIMGETSALQLRAKTQAVGQIGYHALSIVMSVTLPYIFNPDAGNLGGKTGFVYLALCFIGVTLTWFAVPEMKGRNAIEIDHMFALRLPTRKFKGYKMPGDNEDAGAPLAQNAAAIRGSENPGI